MKRPLLSPATGIVVSALCLILVAGTVSAKGIEEKVLSSVPGNSQVIDGYRRPDSVVNRLSEMPLHAIEGLWRFAAEGTLMAIERVRDDSTSPYDANAPLYRMVVVRAADLSLRPGTVMGYLTQTAKRGVYDARIYTSRMPDGVTLSAQKKFTVTLTDDDGRIAISNYGSSMRFNWWRLLPYMYRHLFTKREKSPGNIDGCLRVFPAPSIPTEPRYL